MDTKIKTSSGAPNVVREQIERFKSISQVKLVLIIITLFLVFGGQNVFAQGVGISETTIVPHASAILELKHTAGTFKGFLTPSMTTGDRDGIIGPATGLIIYNTTTNKLNIFDGTVWRVLFSGDNGVNSVSGTLNRISIGGTSADPIIDIDANYIGQASITTLGTITTGTWQADIVEVPYGGTGLASIIANNLIYGNDAGAVNLLAPSATTGTILMNTAAGAPSWSLLTDLPSSAGVLPIANGGTNSGTALNDNRLIISNSGAIKEAAAMTDGQVVVGSTGTAPQLVNLGGDATIDNAGALTLANTAVTANSYGSATEVGTFTVDSKGRLTAAGNVTITGTSPVGSALTGANIWLGDAADQAAAVPLTGDISISNTGLTAIEPGVIVNADINATAAIAATKISVGNVDNTEFDYINGVTSSIQTQFNDITTLADGTIYLGDGANTAQEITVGGDITMANDGVVTLANTAVTANSYGSATEVGTFTVDSKGRLTAAGNVTITGTSPVGSALTGANIWLGDAADQAAAVPLTGDISISNTGLTAIEPGVIVNADINATAAIAATKISVGNVDNTEFDYINGVTSSIQTQFNDITTLADGTIYLGDGANTAQEITVGGDITMANDGVVTLANTAVTANSYGSATEVGTFTVDSKGRLTAAGNVTITGTSPVGSALTGANIWLGDAADQAAAVPLTGDISISNTGLTAIEPGVIVNTDINATAAIAATKISVGNVDNTEFDYINGVTSSIQTQFNDITTLADGTIYLGDGANTAQEITVGGDITMANDGVVTLANTAVTANSYGSATEVGTFTVDSKGRLTAAGNVTITGTSPVGSALTGANIWLGDAADQAAAVPLTGDISISNTGLTAIEPGVIVNADINATAAIAATKISVGNVDNTEFDYINGVTSSIQTQFNDITTLADGTIYLGDGANTAQEITVGGDITMANDGVVTLANTAVTANSYGSATEVGTFTVDSKGRLTAAGNVTITGTSPVGSALTGANIWLGDAADQAAAVPLTGDISISNTGLTAIEPGVIVNADINATAAIAATKISVGNVDNTEFDYINGVTSSIQTQFNDITTLADGTIYLGDGANTAQEITVGGDITMANDGVVTLANTAVTANSYGSATEVGTFTVDSKGRLTAAGNVTITGTSPVGSALTGANIWLGDAADQAAAVPLTGDISISNTGLTAIEPGVIVNTDINATAAIAATKISVGNVDNTEFDYINGVTSSIQTQFNDITTLADGTIYLGDGANTAQEITVGGDITMANDGVVTLANTAVTANSYGSATEVGTFTVDSKGRLTAAGNVTITGTSPVGSALTGANIWLGDAADQAAAVPLTGDISISNTGLTAIEPGVIVNADINATAAIAATKISVGNVDNTEFDYINGVTSSIQTQFNDITTLADGTIYLGDGANTAQEITVGGDITMANDGVVTLANTAVTANSYGSATEVGTFTVDSKGRLTAAGNVTITGTSPVGSALTGANIWLGDAADQAAAVPLTGDISISNTGLTAIEPGVIVNADINATAAIDATKIANGTVTNAEYQYINSLTSNAQTQLNAKLDANAAIGPGTKTKITYDADGLVTAGVDATAADIVNVAAGDIVATDVQGAIDELDTEKIATASVANAVLVANRTTSSDIASDVTGMSFSIGAGEAWSFEFYIQNGCNGAGGTKWAITFPGGNMKAVVTGNRNSATTQTSAILTTSGTLTTSAFNTVVSATGWTRISGVVVNGAIAGTVQLQFASGTNTQTSGVYALSYLTARKVN